MPRIPRFERHALWQLLALAAVTVGAIAVAFPLAAQHSTEMPSREQALPGRSTPLPTASTHFVFHTPLKGPFPAGSQQAIFAMGCFWAAERRFWSIDGVISTAAGYSGGYTPNPTYEEVSSGRTGHAESVLVVFDPHRVTYEQLLRTFWEAHDPTQVMRQGADIGTQYRSAIFATTPEQLRIAERSREVYQRALDRAHFGPIATEIRRAGSFYYAEDYHQQYLAKNPNGYCGHGGTGVSCPIGLEPYPN